jgi:hypothetical protein
MSFLLLYASLIVATPEPVVSPMADIDQWRLYPLYAEASGGALDGIIGVRLKYPDVRDVRDDLDFGDHAFLYVFDRGEVAGDLREIIGDAPLPAAAYWSPEKASTRALLPVLFARHSFATFAASETVHYDFRIGPTALDLPPRVTGLPGVGDPILAVFDGDRDHHAAYLGAVERFFGEARSFRPSATLVATGGAGAATFGEVMSASSVDMTGVPGRFVIGLPPSPWTFVGREEREDGCACVYERTLALVYIYYDELSGDSGLQRRSLGAMSSKEPHRVELGAGEPCPSDEEINERLTERRPWTGGTRFED